jgi:hypothetical protein
MSSSSAAEESTTALEVVTGSARVQIKKPMSPDEILARHRERQGLAGEDDDDGYPKLFEDDLLDNMQKILLTLEKRIAEGPGSLTMLEVEDFTAKSQAILTEMKEKEYSRLQDAGSKNVPATTPNPVTVAATIIEATPVVEAANVQVESLESEEVTNSDDLEDGPAYSSAGGNGSLAKGTVNTYIIPNMDEMSPEEYQKALQESITERQKKRKSSGQQYGNRATWDYLNNLSGSSGVLKATQLED